MAGDLMANRQIIEVVQCRAADLKIGDVIRRQQGEAGWFAVEKLVLLEGSGRLFVQKTHGQGLTLEPIALVDLQLTKTAYSNAPYVVDAELPGGADDQASGLDVSAYAVLPWSDGGDVEVTIYCSTKDGAAVVEIDAPPEAVGVLRVNVNDDFAWGKEYPH